MIFRSACGFLQIYRTPPARRAKECHLWRGKLYNTWDLH